MPQCSATTLRYYADIDADELVADLWKEHLPVAIQLEGGWASRQNLGGTLGGTPIFERELIGQSNDRN